MITKSQINGFVATAHLAYGKQMAYLYTREKKGEDKTKSYAKMFGVYGVIRHINQYVNNFPMPPDLTEEDIVQSCFWVMQQLNFKYELYNSVGFAANPSLYINISEM
jgi:hypothetical protein